MPRLNQLIGVGFCLSYGDGDYQVSMEVQKLSRERMNELMLTAFHAQRHAWDLWWAANQLQQAAVMIRSTEEPK